MDDIFAVFDNDCTGEYFLNVLSLKHFHSKFTIEKTTESF